MKPVAIILCLVVMLGLAVGGVVVVRAIAVEQEGTVSVDIGINYGRDSVEWHNGTAVHSGENLLNATREIATVEFKSFSGMGAFVTSINGLSQDPATNMYWIFWVYNPQTQKYDMGQVGASAYALTSNQTIQWYYENGGSLTNPALKPNTSLSLTAHLDTSTNPWSAVISGSVSPNPGGPVNVTLEYSNDQGATYQTISKITSAPDGTFSYSWKLPSGSTFKIRADAQGVKSAPLSFSVQTSGAGIPGFPVESLLAGGALGAFLTVLGRKLGPRSRNHHSQGGRTQKFAM